MRITKISITNLFGRFNHKIALNMNDRTTIIYGPNGVGKTVLFKLLDGLFNDRYSKLHRVTFENLCISFDDGSSLEVDRTAGQIRGKRHPEQQPPPRLTLHYSKPEQPRVSHELKAPELFIPEDSLRFFDHMVSEVSRVAETTWVHDRTGEVLTLEDMLARYGDRLPEHMQWTPVDQDWWKEIRTKVPVRLIETQRLSASIKATARNARERRLQNVDTLAVSQFAEDLADKIKTTNDESGLLSQSLDRTLVSRLVTQELRDNLPDAELRNKLTALETKRVRLREAGLLGKEDDGSLQLHQFNDRTRGIISVHVQDVEKKLAVFDKLADKIDLFKQIIKDHFKHKFIVVGRDFGFRFLDEDQKTYLGPQELSSGEQHEIVLLYELLFRVQQNSLILMDEPELSLHVVWQRQFLTDIQRIAKNSSIDVILATHSPQIIHDRWDLAVQLGGAEG